jgi:cardiolipin synthase
MGLAEGVFGVPGVQGEPRVGCRQSRPRTIGSCVVSGRSALPRTLWFLGGALAAGLFILGLLWFTRSTPITAVTAVGDTPPAIGGPAFHSQIQLHTGVQLESGNRIEVVTDGAVFDRIIADIAQARRTVTFQTYFCTPGTLANRFRDALAERARAGVRVLVLLDFIGCDVDDAWLASPREAGAQVRWMRTVKWYALHRADNRSHARIVVVDGAIGYTGGYGMADAWLGDGRSGGQWRDTNARFTGPAVAQLQAAFSDAWAETTGELLTGPEFYPAPPDTIETLPSRSSAIADSSAVVADSIRIVAGLLHTKHELGSTRPERLLAVTIAGARRTLYISNAYFIPDDDFRALLIAAARRGVDVRVLTAGDSTDVGLVRAASRAHYASLLEGGVRLYEYLPTMMHAKTFVADGVWTSIGSLNFDNRSMALNDETNLLVLDAGIAASMDSMFLTDLRYAREVAQDVFARRGFIARLRERFAVLLSRML